MTHAVRFVAVVAVLTALAQCAPVPEIDALRARAEAGDAEAQYRLARLYTIPWDFSGIAPANGEAVPDVPMDDVEAARWFRLAADQGHVLAQTDLAIRYENGRGVPQDAAEAVRWYRLAADQGYADAQFSLGARYGNGSGVPEDDAEAARWMRLAADQGHVNAQYTLGRRYENDPGVPQDYVQAHMWYNLVASRQTVGFPGGFRHTAAEARDRVADLMTPTQITEPQRLATEWDAAHPREP